MKNAAATRCIPDEIDLFYFTTCIITHNNNVIEQNIDVSMFDILSAKKPHSVPSEKKFLDFHFLDKNKLSSKFLQTKKEFSKKSEYLPRNWDLSDFHRKINFPLIESILLPV